MTRTVLLTLEELAAVLRETANHPDEDPPLSECVRKFREMPLFFRKMWEQKAVQLWNEQVKP